MSKSNNEVKIVLEDTEGGKWVSNDSYGSLLLDIKYLKERNEWATKEILALRNKVRDMDAPRRAKVILDLVQKQGGVLRSSKFFANRLSYDDWDWQTWTDLVKSGAVEKVKHGRTSLYRFPKGESK